jgi:quinol-cytochrome oxidoreductase complex cytochrome b subunit
MYSMVATVIMEVATVIPLIHDRAVDWTSSGTFISSAVCQHT